MSIPSLSFDVMITTLESLFIGIVASRRTSFTFPAIVALANPAPILWAISRIVTDFSKTFFEPSGKVIIGLIYCSNSKNPNFDLTLFKV